MKFPHSLQQKLPPLAVMLVVGLIGTYLFVHSFAATAVTDLEAESGTVSGTASIISDTNASGGQAVKFGSPQANIKDPVIGAIDRAKQPTASGVTNWIVKLDWATLQPNGTNDALQAGTSGAGGTADLDAALTAAAAQHAVIKVRLLAGYEAPAWAKQLSDCQAGQTNCTSTTPIAIDSTAGDTIGAWWDPAYIAAYDNLIKKVAAAYDNDPLVGEITDCESGVEFCDSTKQMTNSSGGSLTSGNAAILLAHNYTQQADLDAQKASIDTMNHYLVHTRTSYPFFPFQYVYFDSASGSDKVNQDISLTREIMLYGQQTLGSRWIEENLSLSDQRIGNATYTQLWAWMKQDAQAGIDTEYQTSTLAKMTDLCATLNYGVSQLATEIELPDGYGNQTLNGCTLSGINQSLINTFNNL